MGLLVETRFLLTPCLININNNWQVNMPKLYLKKNGVMVFKFKTKEDHHWVLHNGPWLIRGTKPLLLKEWKTDMSIDWKSFESVPLWVKILDIDPIFLSSKHMLEVIGNMIGKPISTDHISNEVEKISYARILVEVMVKEVKRKEVVLESYDGMVYNHKVEFEWIPWHCKNCDTFGHTHTFCLAREIVKNERCHFHARRVWRPRALINNKSSERRTWAQVVDRKPSTRMEKETAKETLPKVVEKLTLETQEHTRPEEKSACKEEDKHLNSTLARGTVNSGQRDIGERLLAATCPKGKGKLEEEWKIPKHTIRPSSSRPEINKTGIGVSHNPFNTISD